MSEQKDIFYLDKVFPEADKIFSETYKGINEILSDCIVILDTNILLVPFDTNEKNLQDIKSIFLRYKSKNSLFIPARVAREFANNRANKIGDIFLQIRQMKDNLNSGSFKVNQYPILESNKDYIEIKNNYKKIQEIIKESRKYLENIENHIQGWSWNDNVSLAYKEIFTEDVIVEVKKEKEKIEEDLAFRIEYKIAPGFKDSKKPDDGIGDLVIWQTILEIAKEKNKDVLFVTNDQKNDWFYKQDKTGLYPKYELFDEFRRYTSGKSIAIVSFVKFLELNNANIATIEDVKTTIKESYSEEYSKNIPDLIEGLEVEHPRFGKGQIIEIKNVGNNRTALIKFHNNVTKTFLLIFAQLKVLDTELNFLLRNPDFDGDHRSYQLKNIEEE